MPRSGMIISRIIVAIGGGYFASSGGLALSCILFVRLGVARSEAVAAGTMLVFVLYLTLILWVFASGSLKKITLIMVSLILAGYGSSYLISGKI